MRAVPSLFFAAAGNFRGYVRLNFGWRLFRKPRRIVGARLNVTKHRADRIRFLDLRVDLRDLACARCCHAHNRLVGFDLHDLLVGHDLFAWLDIDRYNRGLGD